MDLAVKWRVQTNCLIPPHPVRLWKTWYLRDATGTHVKQSEGRKGFVPSVSLYGLPLSCLPALASGFHHYCFFPGFEEIFSLLPSLHTGILGSMIVPTYEALGGWNSAWHSNILEDAGSDKTRNLSRVVS